MITTIKEQLALHGLTPDATVYADSSPAMLDFRLSTMPFLTLDQDAQGRTAVFQKNVVEALPLTDASAQLGMSAPLALPDLPWFCAGLDGIAEARRCGRPIGIIGGPCLFGADEVLVEVIKADGSAQLFDYCTGRHADPDADLTTPPLMDYIAGQADQITAIRFHDQKSGVTSQEHDSIRWLFQAAQPLDARIVIPLPDMSYAKYLQAILAPLPEKLRRQIMDDFTAAARRIVSLYIEETARIARSFPGVEYRILHAQDEALCRRFYEARSPFIDRHRILRNITSIPERFESIKDYISMPALPYYLWGIRDILQVDSLDEVDSFRKCRSAHKGTLRMGCMLYPERLSADGEHTIFQASHAWKEYR